MTSLVQDADRGVAFQDDGIGADLGCAKMGSKTRIESITIASSLVEKALLERLVAAWLRDQPLKPARSS